MDRFGIQINKTSINSVLLIITIGVTWSSIHYLLDALRRVAGDFELKPAHPASQASRALQKRRVEEITTDLPPLPDFSEFDAAFLPDGASPFGDMRSRSTPVMRIPTARTSCSASSTTHRRGQDPGVDHLRGALPAGYRRYPVR